MHLRSFQDYLLDLTRPTGAKLEQKLRDCLFELATDAVCLLQESADEMSRFIESLSPTQCIHSTSFDCLLTFFHV